MSPGPTFDRVYLALKEQLMSGRFAPGDHLEPSLIGDELHSSITPVRDTLHRLVGERLVEAPRNDGFRVPMVTELALRQLYAWQADLMRLAASRQRPDRPLPPPYSEPAASLTVTAFILNLARAAGDIELLVAFSNASERLAALQPVEEQLIPETREEIAAFAQAIETNDMAALRSAIGAYQRRRDRAVPQMVAALQRPF